ncbi:MAG: HPP family protein [Chlorobiaceae bacterium]|jgi:CBS-domain-containing membrane protein|nr:HPP family protein [Chlorobiaceae bacterium]
MALPAFVIALSPSLSSDQALFRQYETPFVDFSQPSNIVGGHVIASIVGVSMYMLNKDTILASATAVSLANIAMHLNRTQHSPWRQMDAGRY